MKGYALAVLLLVAAGCRMYGSDESVQALEDGIRQEAAALAAARDEVKLNAAALEALAEDDQALTLFAQRLVALGRDYDALVEFHRETAAREGGGLLGNSPLVAWIGRDRYRGLHRTYGAMIAEQRVLTDRYEALRSDMQVFATGSVAMVPQEVGRYQIAPQFYRRLEHAAQRQELSDILASMNAGP